MLLVSDNFISVWDRIAHVDLKSYISNASELHFGVDIYLNSGPDNRYINISRIHYVRYLHVVSSVGISRGDSISDLIFYKYLICQIWVWAYRGCCTKGPSGKC